MLYFYGLPLDLCGKRIALFFLPNAPRFLPMRHNSAKRTTFSREKPRNPWITALYKTAHFQELRRTQRDKRGARYAALISAAAACLLNCF